jgi:hypothetical protein
MKTITTLLLLTLLICNYSFGEIPQLQNALATLEQQSSIARGSIIQISKTEFRYDYYDVNEKDSDFEFLIAKGYQGGGPSWEGIVYGILTLENPKILTEIRFDAEGEGLSIISSSKASLEKIALLVAKVKSNRSLLLKAIERAKKDQRME